MTLDDRFYNRRFDVENSLNLVSDGYVVLPASHLYDTEALKSYESIISNCHIYLIGFTPSLSLENVTRDGNIVTLHYLVGGAKHVVHHEIPNDWELKYDGTYWYCEDTSGERFGPNLETQTTTLANSLGGLDFIVKYIGQAYGKDGSRSAKDRLVSHSTLQEIALKGVPNGHVLQIIMIELMPNRLLTVFYPDAKETDYGEDRIKAGLDKLFGTSEKERITLYEASFIRYFRPEYNIEFKNSFPSTNMKVLEDCYNKDFNSIISEFSLDGFFYKLQSESVEPNRSHIAYYELHNEDDRRLFFMTDKA